MKLREILLDAVIGTRIFEMAFKRKIAIDRVRSKQFVIAAHLVKLSMFPSRKNVDAWKKELNGWLGELNDATLKPYGDRLYSDTFREILFDEPLGLPIDTYNCIKRVYREHNKSVPGNVNPEQVNKELALIYKSISDDLAIGNFTHIDNYL